MTLGISTFARMLLLASPLSASKLFRSKHSLSIQPKNPQQFQYLNYLKDPEVTVCLGIGPAGTGKTILACQAAMESYERGNVTKLVLTRPLISVNKEEMGFLPGDIAQKMDPWMLPMLDAFSERWSKAEVKSMVRAGSLEIAPLGFMRGRTFKQSYVLADEIQNATPEQVLMLLTRMGDGSKMAITGDVDQSDIGAGNGLEDLLRRLAHHRGPVAGMRYVTFGHRDVERSAIVKTVLELYK